MGELKVDTKEFIKDEVKRETYPMIIHIQTKTDENIKHLNKLFWFIIGLNTTVAVALLGFAFKFIG